MRNNKITARKLNIVKLAAPTSRTRDVRSAFVKVAREAKDSHATKAVIIIMSETDEIRTEYAGVSDKDKVFMLEAAKHLLIRDMYGK